MFSILSPLERERIDEWKDAHRHAYGPHELYDLANEPGERRNQADDPALRGRVAELRRRMEEWFERCVDPENDGLRQDG